MAFVEQMDLFDYLQEIEVQEAAIRQSPPAPAKCDPLLRRASFLNRLGSALTWFWIVAHNLFGLARWVNVYTVTRAFGGREAGGWYYLKYECEESRQVGFWEAEHLRRRWLQQYTLSHKWGEPLSQTGGRDVIVCIELRKAARNMIRPPCYDDFADRAIPYTLVQGGNSNDVHVYGMHL